MHELRIKIESVEFIPSRLTHRSPVIVGQYKDVWAVKDKLYGLRIIFDDFNGAAMQRLLLGVPFTTPKIVGSSMELDLIEGVFPSEWNLGCLTGETPTAYPALTNSQQKLHITQKMSGEGGSDFSINTTLSKMPVEKNTVETALENSEKSKFDSGTETLGISHSETVSMEIELNEARRALEEMRNNFTALQKKNESKDCATATEKARQEVLETLSRMDTTFEQFVREEMEITPEKKKGDMRAQNNEVSELLTNPGGVVEKTLEDQSHLKKLMADFSVRIESRVLRERATAAALKKRKKIRDSHMEKALQTSRTSDFSFAGLYSEPEIVSLPPCHAEENREKDYENLIRSSIASEYGINTTENYSIGGQNEILESMIACVKGVDPSEMKYILPGFVATKNATKRCL